MTPESELRRSPGGRELIALVASLMGLNALAIDLMLPALGAIALEYGLSDPNDQQLIIVAYVLGFGAPQLVVGPAADRLGRRPILFVSLIGFAIAGATCAIAPSFLLLLLMRFLQGVFASGCRVAAVAIVRDLYQGRGMARVMSLVMTVFMVVPILAPGLGQLLLLVAPWRWCFGVLVLASALLLLWVATRLDETLAEPSSLGVRAVVGAYASVLRHRVTLGYMLASGVVFGALFAFISACEQIFREVFGEGERFGMWFAFIAMSLSVANFTNSRLVERFGMRRLGHLALVGFTLSAGVLLAVMMFVGEYLWLFLPMFAACFACFGLIGANFNAMAMEPLGRIAGTASAAYGFATTTLSGVLGGIVARAYDGTTVPLLIGFVSLGVVAFALVWWTERGVLFQEPSESPGRMILMG